MENIENTENLNNEEMTTNYEEKIAEEHNNYLRALADSENIRKHFLKKLDECNQYKNESLMKDILPVIDDIHRANSNEEISDGIKCIITKFLNILSTYELKECVVSKGDTFNADTMEAVATVSVSEEDKNKVIDITQTGYMYKDKIIRYPKVVVGC